MGHYIFFTQSGDGKPLKMPNALVPYLAPITFALTGVGAASVFIRYFVRFVAATRLLAREYSLIGISWNYWEDLSFRWQVFRDPESIVVTTDPAGVRAAKEQLIKVRSSMWVTIAVGVAVMVAGGLLTVGAGILSIYLQRSS